MKNADQTIKSPQEYKDVLSELLKFAWIHVCPHEETHRGGAIWEICDTCGEKWADDEGGKPEFVTPKAITNAENLLSRIEKPVGMNINSEKTFKNLIELLESALGCMVIGINDYSIADKETIDRGYRLLAEVNKIKDDSD